MPLFNRTDWRLFRFAALIAIPLEAGALWVLSTLPLDFEPPVRPGTFVLWSGVVAEIIHFPSLSLLQTGLTNSPFLLQVIFFLTGYADLLLLFSLVLLLYRGIKKLTSRH